MRYTVKLDAYVYAENDEEAKAKATKLANFLQTLEDNNAQVIELTETPYGSLTSREVDGSNQLAKLLIEKHKKNFSEICR